MTALNFNSAGIQPLKPIENIKARADLVDVASRYADLKLRSGYHWAKCPFHTDKTPSLRINVQRQAFICYGCGAKGDVFDFVMAAESIALAAAIERVQELVGGATPDPAASAARVARRVAGAAQEAHDAARRSAQAQEILAESGPLTRRSAELPVRYLTERRGINLWQPYFLRWHPACPWGRERVGCIVVPVSNVEGDVTGVWRIRPSLEGRVERRGLGAVLGGCARVIDDAALPIIAVAEGIEDALSAWVLTTYPCWAALSTAGMAALELPAAFREVLVCADADSVGLAAAKALAIRMRAQGREVRVIQPLAGKDPNDVLQSRSAA